MTTVINNPQPTERTVVESDSSGWIVSVLILIAVILGGIYWWMHYSKAPAVQQQGTRPSSAVINVSVPTGGGNPPAAPSGN